MKKFNIIEGQFEQIDSNEEEKRDILISWLVDNIYLNNPKIKSSDGWIELDELIEYEEENDIFETPEGYKFKVNLKDKSVKRL